MRKFGKGLLEYLLCYISLFVILGIYFVFYLGLNVVAPILIIGLTVSISYKIISFFKKRTKEG